MANKRQRKKRAKTKQRKGTLYIPRSPFRSMIEIKSVDIDPNNKQQQQLLSSAQFNLFQIEHYLYDKIELEAVDVDTLKYLASANFRALSDDVANWARYDPEYYTATQKGGRVFSIISKTVSYYFNRLDNVNASNIIKAFNTAYKDLKANVDKYTKGKKIGDNNPIIIVYYNDINIL